MISQAMSTRAILQEIAARLRRERLNQSIPQTELAAKAGTSRRVVQYAESTGKTTLETFVNLLRALGKVDQLDLLLPDPGPSPLQLAHLAGKQPQRASTRRRKKNKDS